MSEINLNEEVEMVVEDASVITTPIDDTLTQSGEAADAKAVGDALATKADISQVTGITVNGQSPDAQGAILIDGDEIPVSGTDSTLLVEALAALDAKTGEDIPIDSESGADSIADAIGSIQTALATGVVATSEQTLETAQKAQARENIAAASQADVNTINTVTTYALNGSTATGKWSFEEGVKRLHVELGKLDFVCTPVIFEEMMLAFEVQPGQVVFLVDQARRHAFAPKSFEQLLAYLKDYERRGIIEIDDGKRPDYKLYQSFFSTVDWGELQRRYQEETHRREARMHTPLMNALTVLIMLAMAGGLVALRGMDGVRYALNIFLRASTGMQLVYAIGLTAILLLAFGIIRMFISGTTFSSKWIEDFAESCKKNYFDNHPYLSPRQVQQIRKIKTESFEREIR